MEKLIQNNLRKKEVIMVLVLFLLGLLIFLILISLLIIASTLKIQIKNLEASNITQISNKNEEVIISLWAFDRIKWISIHLDKKRLKKINQKMDFKKIDIKKLENNFKWSDLKQIPKLQIKISKLNLSLKLGIGDAVLTAYCISIIASLISIFLPHVAKKIERKNYQYDIEPLYFNKYSYEIKFNCIIEVKMVHIINTIYSLRKKGKRDLYERTSNRRTYGYGHEQYSRYG